MAERIKYQYINSVKQGTEEQREPNSTSPPGQSEPNSTSPPGQSEPNSNNRVLTHPHSESFTKGKNWLKSLVDLPIVAEGDEKKVTLFDYTDDNAEGDSKIGENAKIIGGADPPSGDDSSSSDEAQDDTSEKSESKKSQEAHTTDEYTEQSKEWEKSPSEDTREYGSLPPVSRLNEPVDKEKLIESQRPSEMVNGPLRGVPYYRTSSEEENDDSARITIDQQKPLVDAAFQAFNIERVHDPITDKAISGETFDRDGLERIEALAESGEMNVLVVSDIDRLGRICEKTIEFAKKLRYEHDVYVVSNVRWYDISNGDDLETFNAKAGRAEAENKKRGGRGNRGKLFKLLDKGSDAYLSWYNNIPVGCKEDEEEEHGIKVSDDQSRKIPKIVLEEFMSIDVERNEYAATEEKVRERLQSEFGYEWEGELGVKTILQNPIYTGRAVLTIQEPETHSVDEAEIVIEMPDLQLYDTEEVELWEQAQEKIARLEDRYRNKTEARPETHLADFGPKVIDNELAAWTLICPECGSTSDYQYQGTRTDADGTKRQKCKCTGGDGDTHFFRVPTRTEFENLSAGYFEDDTSSSED